MSEIKFFTLWCDFLTPYFDETYKKLIKYVLVLEFRTVGYQFENVHWRKKFQIVVFARFLG